MFTERCKITKIGKASWQDGGYLIKNWTFNGSTLVDSDNNPVTNWQMVLIKLGRLLRFVFGYRIASYFSSRKRKNALVSGWTFDELATLSGKNKKDE